MDKMDRLAVRNMYRLAEQYNFTLACFMDTHRIWIVPEPPKERQVLTGDDLIAYHKLAFYVARWNRMLEI